MFDLVSGMICYICPREYFVMTYFVGCRQCYGNILPQPLFPRLTFVEWIGVTFSDMIFLTRSGLLRAEVCATCFLSLNQQAV